MTDTEIAFRVREHESPALEVRVNFGLFAGRAATPAEIDDLAHALHAELPSFAIVSEERHEFGGVVEASLRQVVIEIPREHAGDDVGTICDRVVAVASGWAESCFAARPSLGEL